MSLHSKERESKPSALAPIFENIPDSLQCLNQFGVWRFEEFADEDAGEVWWDKIPINARTGRRASSTNPATWSTFAQAVKAYERGGFDGLAFFLKPGGGLVGIDLDKCRDRTTGAIEAWAQSIVDRLGTYGELSPSGRGLRLFVWGELPPRDRREGRFECYSSARFLTLTGRRITPFAIEHRQAELTAIHTEVFAARVAKRNAAPPVLTSGYRPHNLSDLQIIDKARSAKNGAKFRALYGGDISGHGSHSEADAALCSMLAFYCGPDPARIDELFRGSALFRGKWNRPDYRDSTINLALEGRTEFYQPRRGRALLNGHPFAAGDGQQAIQERDDIHLTDLGNARRVVERHGKDLRFCPPWKKWLLWQNGRWCMDALLAVAGCARDVPRELFEWAQKEIAELSSPGKGDSA